MPNFLFWNINRKPLQDVIAEAAHGLGVDVLLLAESASDPAQMLLRLNLIKTSYFFIRSLSPRISMYVRFDPTFVHVLDEGERYSISRVRLPARKEILLVTAHLPSKREFSGSSQTQECARLSRLILSAEESAGHRRTLFIGDVNVNPFEDGMVAAGSFHAVMTKDLAMRGARTVQGEKYPFFYNPMWGHFGDRVDGPPGTFFYEKAEHTVFFWNIFDQVLLRPELAVNFRHEDLTILSTVGNRSLVTSAGKPDTSHASDHLPVLLRLEF
jgi:hypothetical protein